MCPSSGPFCEYTWTLIVLIVGPILLILTYSMGIKFIIKIASWLKTPSPKNIKLSCDEKRHSDKVQLKLCNREWRKPFMECFLEVRYGVGKPHGTDILDPKNYYRSYATGGGIDPKWWKIDWEVLKVVGNPDTYYCWIPKNECRGAINFIKLDSENNTLDLITV